MALVKLTFDESVNTAKNDSYENYYNSNFKNGIYKGILSECQASQSNGTITFKAGVVCVYGRRVLIEAGTSIKVTLDTERCGYVVARIDTDHNTATLALKEGSATAFPSLTQANLMTGDGVFELPIVSYTKTASSLSLGMNNVEYITSRKTDIDYIYNTLNNKINGLQQGMVTTSIYRSSVSSSDGCRTFKAKTYIDAHPNLLIFVWLAGTCIICPMAVLRGTSSGLQFFFKYVGSDCSVWVEYSASTGLLYVTPTPGTINFNNITLCW